jgi:peptide/nickel transport system permease protein
MARVIWARATMAVVLLLAASFLSFALLHASPGTFLDQLRFHPGISQSVLDVLEKRYGLDRPWHIQYAHWLMGALRGDFGLSLSYQRPVNELLRDAVPRTLALTALAQLAGAGLGVALGLLAVRRLHGGLDRWACRFALVLAAVHPIVLSLAGLAVAASTGLLPIGGGSASVATTPSSWSLGADFLRHLLLPASILTVFMIPGFFLQARGAFTEVLAAPFVQAAKAAGVSRGAILRQHVLPAGLVPLLGYASVSVARLLNGAFLVEVVTGWPGMGRLTMTAMHGRDPFLLLGTLVFASVLLLGGNLVSDILLALADPRVRLEERPA